VNLVERGDRVLVLLNGVFGMRMADVAMNPVAEIGDLLKGSDSICLADAFTSLGGIEVRMDDWDIDALSSGTQKCLSCPPGLALLSFLEKAMGILNKRKTKVPKWYLNLSLIADYWGQNRVYHHTALVNMLYGLFYIRRCFFFLRKDRKRYFSDTKKTIRLL